MRTTQNTHGAVATSHHLATEAGARALEAGGTAVDAALAAAATLCVVYPNNVALGGDLVAIVRSPDGEVSFLNATGTAPKGQTLAALQEKHGSKLPLRGIDTVTLPGGVAGWNSLHQYGAKRSWAAHFKDAIELARDGFPNSSSVAKELATTSEALENDPGAREIFFSNGKPLAEGETLRQPALAKTLEAIAAGGTAEFYEGETAKQWVAGLNRLGSAITLDDTREYEVEWSEAISTNFEDLEVITSPPNTSGFILLRALNAISAGKTGDKTGDALTSGAGKLAQVFAEANAVRAGFLADPKFGGLPADNLVSMELKTPHTGEEKASGDTVGISAVCDDGWAVSLINSIYWGFGAHILEPTTGIIFQNRGTSFSLEENHPNVFAPGKRPRHTLMPVLVLKDGNLEMVPATMGGSAQPQIHTQLILKMLAGATPAEAIASPRWAVNDATADGTIEIEVEADVAETTKTSLKQTGFKINEVPPLTETLGHSNVIRIVEDSLIAGSDPRSNGSAKITGTK